MQYWLDSNVFIEAKRRYYRFKVVPAFWNWVDEAAENGSIVTSTEVFDELKGQGDDLANWVADRKESSLFVPPSDEAQRVYSEISEFVVGNYEAAFATEFLDKADPWLIAQAKAADADDVVVTQEVWAPADAKKVKIPNICGQFGGPYRNTFEAMEDLGAVLE